MNFTILIASSLGVALLTAQSSFAQDAGTGERLFRQRCASCHSVQPGQNRIGPHLSGVVGRKPGSIQGARYSKALSALEPNWDATSLDAFLTSPRTVAPGTSMTVSVPNPTDRGNIIAYLQSLTTAN